MMAAVDLECESDRDLLDAAVRVQAERNRLEAQQLRIVEAIDRREAYAFDGAVTTASWLRHRTRQTHSDVSQQVNAAVRLRDLPKLCDAFQRGDVAYRHVTAVTKAAVPTRIDAIAGVESTLVDLARDATPTEVAVAVKRIGDAVDTDGSDPAEPACPHGPDERRELHVFDGIDGLAELRATLDPVDAEALRTTLDVLEEPDPPDTPAHKRRSAAQRRADAFARLLQIVLRSGDLPSVEGYPAQLSVVVDLLSLLGLDRLTDTAQIPDATVEAIAALADVDAHTARRIADAAITRSRTGDAAGIGQPLRTPRARFSGPVDIDVVRRLADHAKVQAILTLGPYRVVNVGRIHRTLPPWLRTALSAVHGRCRGPDCDRPTPWTDAHHHEEWVRDHGDTDVNTMTPECRAHHGLLAPGGWTVTLDCESGTCTWTGPHSQTITTHPPPL